MNKLMIVLDTNKVNECYQVRSDCSINARFLAV
jgi:hypothetical protein